MPFNLIPPTKYPKGKKSHIGVLALKKVREPKKLIYLGILVLGIVLVLGFYGIVKKYQSSLERRVVQLEEQNRAVEQEKRSLKERGKLADFQDRLVLLEGLIENHAYWNNLFTFLEEITLPKVQFTNFSANLDNQRVLLEGRTISFTKLAEQIIALKSHALVEELKLSSFRIVEEGVNFNFQLQLSSEIWQETNLEENES